MNQEAIIIAVRAFHRPEGAKEPMVYEVWEDGEITLTKGDDLYGQRNLHCIVPGRPDKALPPTSLFANPWTEQHSRIIVMNNEAARAARKLITGEEF